MGLIVILALYSGGKDKEWRAYIIYLLVRVIMGLEKAMQVPPVAADPQEPE